MNKNGAPELAEGVRDAPFGAYTKNNGVFPFKARRNKYLLLHDDRIDMLFLLAPKEDWPYEIIYHMTGDSRKFVEKNICQWIIKYALDELLKTKPLKRK